MKLLARSIFTLICIFSFFTITAAETDLGLFASEKDRIFKLVVPTYTMAVVTEACELREEPFVLSKAVATLKKGVKVEVLRDKSEKWYKVQNDDLDAYGWIPAKLLEINDATAQKLPDMTREDLEAFAELMNFSTKTGYFVWTDIARQKTHVFRKKDGFTLVRSMDCATGKPTSPTTRGFFTVHGRGKWFYSSRFQSGAMYWVRFNETYLFHSVAMDKNKNIIDGVLGERRSSGCVRLSVEDARWVFENIKDGSAVFVH